MHRVSVHDPRHCLLIRIHVRSVPNAALGGTASKVMLNAESFKYLNVARVHPYRDINLNLTTRNAHYGVEILVQSQQLSRSVKAFAHCFEWIFLVTARKPA